MQLKRLKQISPGRCNRDQSESGTPASSPGRAKPPSSPEIIFLEFSKIDAFWSDEMDLKELAKVE